MELCLGYSIGGKTGTSEPPVGREEDGYVASYIAISPVEDTRNRYPCYII